MQEKDFNKLTNTIQEKLGEEASKIADDIATLITDNSATNKIIKEKDAMIEKLKADKEALIQVNGNLLQQVAMGEEETHVNNPEEKPKVEIDFRKAFDKYGNFIK